MVNGSLYDDEPRDIGLGHIIFGGVIVVGIIGLLAFVAFVVRDSMRGGDISTLYIAVTVIGAIIILILCIIGYIFLWRKKDQDSL